MPDAPARTDSARECTFAPEARIVLTSDHAGAVYKYALAERLRAAGYASVTALGAAGAELSADYPVCAAEACRFLLERGAGCGIFICGSGVGVSMAANRFPGIRAALCADEETAILARRHNDANVLCLGARAASEEALNAIINAFLRTAFDGGRHARRVAQLSALPNEEI